MRPTPKFNNPPVNETVLGVSFNPLFGWQVPQFGLFWSEIKETFPQCQVQPPLPIEREAFGDANREFTLKLGRSDDRCWYIHSDQRSLLQVQNSRFISNWRRQGSDVYEGYEASLERFLREWDRFVSFLERENLGTPELTQVEVTYVNNVSIAEGYSNLSEVFPVWAGFKDQPEILSTPPDAVALHSVYVIPDNRGRLYIRTEPVVVAPLVETVMQLTLTANVLVASNSRESLLEGLTTAHEWVVCGFADFTSETMHEAWGRTDK